MTVLRPETTQRFLENPAVIVGERLLRLFSDFYGAIREHFDRRVNRLVRDRSDAARGGWLHARPEPKQHYGTAAFVPAEVDARDVVAAPLALVAGNFFVELSG